MLSPLSAKTVIVEVLNKTFNFQIHRLQTSLSSVSNSLDIYPEHCQQVRGGDSSVLSTGETRLEFFVQC